MNRRHFWFVFIVAAALAAEPEKPKTTNTPGLQVTAPAPTASTNTPKPTAKSEPLLLLDDTADSKTSEKPGADNSRCEVCHLNFMQEDLTKTHAQANIGCAKCHGVCDAHIADESWASGGNGTAPDTMYPKAKINPFCLECHPRVKIGLVELHKDFFAGKSQDKYCTDCHGKHRMVKRKCKWK
jgi:hypothetical protein